MDERIKHIVSQIEYYGYSRERVKGLIFCRTLKEAHDLSESERMEAISRLVDDSREDKLDYILTCGIFNEGVDIPEVNQVVMLRPTESSIIFIQQLGRGLRKFNDRGTD